VRRQGARKTTFLLASFFLALPLTLGSPLTSAPQKKTKLEKSYREWLEHDVVYIITKNERDEFQRLTSDEARDKFIADFWDVRNPEPGAPTNSYKDEIYRRIAFANARFGVGSGAEGWRSDRGRTYVTLGEPQQKQVFRNSANLYPIEIWFYGNANPALPPAFYVMFYQREGSGDYRFYSPYVDGPDKLVTGVEAINSRGSALKMIRDSVGPEVARIALSLLPDEPVDSGQPSLESDILLGKIKSLANQTANRDEIIRRRSLRESVTTRLLLEGKNLEVVTFPARDSRGLTRLDYAIRLHNPSDLTLLQENGRFAYSVEVRVMVYTPDNKLIFTQQKSLHDSLDKNGMERIKEKVYGYQGSLPLPPGKYRLDLQFTDWSKKAAYRTTRDVSIPSIDNQGLLIPAVLPFSSAEDSDPALSDLTPFTFAGVHFVPTTSSSPAMAPGTNLQVMYQIWSKPADPKTYLGQKLQVEYAFGRPAARGSIKSVKDSLDMAQFDPAGDIVTGKKLSLEQQVLGNYLLTVTLSNPSTGGAPVFATTSFRILNDGGPESWDALEPGISEDAEKGILDQQRGQCYLALGEPLLARTSFRRALQLNHANDIARARLVDLYYSQKGYAAVVSLFEDAGVTNSTDSETLVRIAASLSEAGKTAAAISMLEKALNTRPEEGPLYLALAGYYGQIGNPAKAAEVKEKGRARLAAEQQRSPNR
jgi:GWxTD domain-containing protein